MGEGASAHDYRNIAARWKELSGSNNWDGLLDPLDVDLRRYILHYADMGLAIGDALIKDQHSPAVGRSRYTKKALLECVGLIKGRNHITDYEVTKFVYIHSRDKLDLVASTSFGGYVAVTRDSAKKVLRRRDILVAWRGTIFMAEAMEDLDAAHVDGNHLFGVPNKHVIKLHEGFVDVYTRAGDANSVGASSARDQVLKEVERLVELYKGEEMSITIAGHSMGSALGTLNAIDIVSNGYNKPKGTDTVIPVAAIVSGTPRVGNEDFKEYVEKLSGLHILRVVDHNDPVKNLPPEFIPIPLMRYEHVGVELKVDSSKSPYILSGVKAHYDQAYLHGVAGWQGNWLWSKFKLVVNRDLALLNKAANALKDEYKKAPEEWWVVTNKGMVQQDDGTWLLDTNMVPHTD